MFSSSSRVLGENLTEVRHQVKRIHRSMIKIRDKTPISRLIKIASQREVTRKEKERGACHVRRPLAPAPTYLHLSTYAARACHTRNATRDLLSQRTPSPSCRRSSSCDPLAGNQGGASGRARTVSRDDVITRSVNRHARDVRLTVSKTFGAASHARTYARTHTARVCNGTSPDAGGFAIRGPLLSTG